MTAAVHTTAMVTRPSELSAVLDPMARDYPEIHGPIIEHLPTFMRRDGSIEVTVRDLSRHAAVPFGAAKEYLRVARERGLLHLLGRRLEGGQLRYCAYQPIETAPEDRR